MAPMSADRHAQDASGHEGAVARHRPDDHGQDHGHDDHADGGEETLGPIDLAAWLAGLAGVAIAVAIAVAFAIATSGLA